MADLTKYNQLREHYGLPAMEPNPLGSGFAPVGGFGETPGFVTNQATGMKSPVLSTPNASGISTYQNPSGATKSVFTGLGTGASGQPGGLMPFGAGEPPSVSGDMRWIKTDLGYELRPNENYYERFGYGQGGTPDDYYTGAFSSYYKDNPIFKPQTQSIPAGGVPQDATADQYTRGDSGGLTRGDSGGVTWGDSGGGAAGTDGYYWPQDAGAPTGGTGTGTGGGYQGTNAPPPAGYQGGSLLQQANIGEVASYNPFTNQVEYNELVQNQLANAMNTPYAELARKRALDDMNARGLLNSSLAQGAATRAAIEASLPVAQQDASTFAETRFRGNDAINQALVNNTAARNEMTGANMDALNAFGLDAQQFQQQMALTGTEHGQQQWLAGFDRDTRGQLTDMAIQSDEFLNQTKLTQQNKEFIADKLNDNNHWVMAAVTEIQKMEDLSPDQRNILLEEIGVIHRANLKLLSAMNLADINWTGISPPEVPDENNSENSGTDNESDNTGSNDPNRQQYRDNAADESMYM